jgi:hypothetical protein
MFSVLGGHALIVRDDRKPYHSCWLPKTAGPPLRMPAP